jgi:MFS family permease
MASFSGGTAVGPVVGTVLLQYIGLSRTYLTVGGLFMALAALNSKLPETSPAMNQPFPHLLVEKKMSHTQQLYRVIQGTKDSFGVSWTAWKKLWKGPALRNVVLLQGSFWFVLSGSQMTLLPLLLLSPTLQLSSVEIGSSFAFMSLVAFAASQPSAFLADRYGKVPNMLAGCSILAVSGQSQIRYPTNLT